MTARQRHPVLPYRGSCFGCEQWEVRFQVAMRASCYIGHHIRQEFLLAAVLEHVTAHWFRFVEHGGRGSGWDEFFDGYRADVEADVDARAINTSHHPWEYYRVWTNHAAMLRGEYDRVRSRPSD